MSLRTKTIQSSQISNKYRNFLISREDLTKKSRSFILREKYNFTNKTKLPPAFSLASKIDKVYDQLEINSCTANVLCQLYKVLDSDESFEPSRLFVYYKERQIRGNIATDDGANVIDGLKYLSAHGVCSEKLWPYVTGNVFIQPPTYCTDEAKNHKISNPMMIDGSGETLLKNLKHAIVSGRPVMCGVMIHESFMSESVARSGNVSMPQSKKRVGSIDTEDPLLGGHELLIVGYDDAKGKFLLVNSWGQNWGTQPPGAKSRGYLWIPYSYIADPTLVQDFCTFDSVVRKTKYATSQHTTVQNIYMTGTMGGILCHSRNKFTQL